MLFGLLAIALNDTSTLSPALKKGVGGIFLKLFFHPLPRQRGTIFLSSPFQAEFEKEGEFSIYPVGIKLL
jgi:hypothetical protein